MKQTMKKANESYLTKDLYEAATLYTLKQKLLRLEKEGVADRWVLDPNKCPEVLKNLYVLPEEKREQEDLI